MQKIINIIKSKINLDEKSINNIISLLEDGSTIAFIARYRKDMTSNASDETLLKFQEIYEYGLKLIKRKDEILNILKEKNELTPKINELLENALTLTALEDIYEPFKGVKSSRALDAIKNNLDGLANIISSMKYSIDDVKNKAMDIVNSLSMDMGGCLDIDFDVEP